MEKDMSETCKAINAIWKDTHDNSMEWHSIKLGGHAQQHEIKSIWAKKHVWRRKGNCRQRKRTCEEKMDIERKAKGIKSSVKGNMIGNEGGRYEEHARSSGCCYNIYRSRLGRFMGFMAAVASAKYRQPMISHGAGFQNHLRVDSRSPIAATCYLFVPEYTRKTWY